MAKTKESQIRASNKYNKQNTKSLIIRLNNKTDDDIIKKLQLVNNKSKYIKELIRSDMASDK